jgi:hypothetical protein
MYSFLHTKPISWSDLITYPRWRCPARWSTWLRVLGSVHAPSRRGAVRMWWLGVWRRAKRWWDLALPVRVCWLLSAWLLSHGTEPRRGACISPGVYLYSLSTAAWRLYRPFSSSPWASNLVALYRRGLGLKRDAVCSARRCRQFSVRLPPISRTKRGDDRYLIFYRCV